MQFAPKNIAIVSAALALGACGGSGGSSNNNNEAAAETGVFVDSPVANIGYRTATREGVTSADGEYDYEPGETVTFFIGDLEFPGVPASGVVTPLDIAGTTDTSDDMVVNIARLLQTLDTDGDPSNGISISDLAKDNASQVDFSLSVADFASSSAVTTLVQNGGQASAVTELVSAEAAKAHLENTLQSESVSFTNETSVTGGWVLDTSEETGNGAGHFIFFAFDAASGTYVHVEEKEFAEELEEGMEFGTFSVDDSNRLTVTGNIFDENGAIGIHPPEAGVDFNFIVAGSQADLEVVEGGEVVETIPASRVVANGLVGTWFYEEADVSQEELLMLAFLPDGTYVHAEVLSEASTEEMGAEIGSYSHDTNTGVVSVSDIIVDTNSDAGLSDFVGNANLAASVSGNTLTLSVTEDGGTEQLIFKRL
ncbi:MAG: hypothetical protein ACQEV6_07370 [Pseudomonadota bacterium]